jgi:hypothetical protein
MHASFSDSHVIPSEARDLKNAEDVMQVGEVLRLRSG